MDNLIFDRMDSDLANLTSKAYYNYEDLNRIEKWCKYLSEFLNNYNYFVSIEAKTDWSMLNFPTQSELERIRQNINRLQQAYFSFTQIPENLEYMTWRKANDIEKILYEINTLLNNMISQFYHCGEVFSGEV